MLFVLAIKGCEARLPPKNTRFSLYSLIGIVPACSTLVGHDEIRQIDFDGRQGNVGMAILSAVGTKEDVRTVIGVNVGGNSILGAVVGTSVSNFQVVGELRSVSGMILEAIQVSCCRVLGGLLLAGFSGQVDEFEGVGTSQIRKWWWVVRASVFLAGIVNANQRKKLVGKNTACVGLEIEPGTNVASLALLVGPVHIGIWKNTVRKRIIVR